MTRFRRSLRLLPAAAVAAALPLASCAPAAETAAPVEARGVPVRTAPVESRDLDEVVTLTGTLRPRKQVQVVARVAARLLRVLRDEGGRVSTGETLAVLDETDYRLAHERAGAALAVAEANRAHALAEKERADNLLQTGGVTDKDHLAAQVALQVSEASLAQARVEVAIAAEQLDRCRVTAPFAGRIARRVADPGAMLASGAALFTLVDDSVLEFRGEAPSTDWGRFRTGDAVRLEVDAAAVGAVEGRVARLPPLVDERSRSFEVVVEVAGRDGLVGGLFARAEVRVGRAAGALVVPPSSLVRSGAPGVAELFVVSGGKADRRQVRLGVERPDAVQVVEGVAAGDVVIVDPPAALGDGSPVLAVEASGTRG
jgi:membrane fusion protein, multidrug efflux system